MAWTGNSNPALVAAIIRSFRDSPEDTRRLLCRFKPPDWRRTEVWLDNSGLALYFLDHVGRHGLSDCVDAGTVQRLRQKLLENRERKDDMLREFIAINGLFRDAGLRYANLKGFTLAPDSCPDLSVRRQSDLDFLIDSAHMDIGRNVLEKRGYEIVCATDRTIELKSGHSQKVSLDGRYRATPVRSVELHTALGPDLSAGEELSADERLHRLSVWSCEVGSFPALSPADQFIGQALHLLGHLLSEHTRASWLLEYRNHVLARQTDRAFWIEVRRLALRQKDATIAIGLSTLLADELFGELSVSDLDSWSIDVLPVEIRLWAEQYGNRAVMAEVPGTKLYLLLDAAIARTRSTRTSNKAVSRLFPVHGPPRILRPPPKDTILLRFRREVAQLHYILYRTRFHIVQGAAYAIERRRWTKLLRGDCQTSPR